jgi:hypothetical protein
MIWTKTIGIRTTGLTRVETMIDDNIVKTMEDNMIDTRKKHTKTAMTTEIM